MDSLWQDLRYGLRTLKKSPSFTLIAIVTLALGMGVNTTIFGVVNGLLLRPLPVPNAEQITVLALQQPGTEEGRFFSYSDYKDVEKQTDSFSGLLGYQVSLVGLVADGRGDHCIVSRVTANYFSALGIKPALGRLILPTEGQTPGDDPIVILGHSYWQRRFGGDGNVIGKQVEINNHPATIVGVTPKEFHGVYSILDMDAYVPLSAPFYQSDTAAQQEWTQRNQRNLRVLGRLKRGVTLKQAQASLGVIARRLAEQYPDTDKAVTIQIYPEKLARPDPDPQNPLPAVAAAFLILAALVVLVACFNIANVLLVRATTRQREMAIRAALGARRGRLVRQHLMESFVLALFGGGAGLLLTSYASGFLSSLDLKSDLPFRLDFSPDSRVFLFVLATVGVTAVIVGIVPALRVARTDVVNVLHEGGRGSSDGPRRHFARNTLVVVQVAGSLLLLIVAGLFVRSLEKAQHMYLGFDPDHVLNLTLAPDEAGYKEARVREFYRELEKRLKTLPGVVSAAQAFSVPMGYISSSNQLMIEGHPVEPGRQLPNVRNNMVSPSYFETLRVPLLKGRTFTEADNEKAPMVAVINQTMAKKFWPNEDPIGKRFTMKGAPGKFIEVIGIVQDGKYESLTDDPAPFFYLPVEQQYTPLRTIHVRASVPPETLAPQIESQIRDLGPGVPISQVQTMNQALQGANGFLLFRFGAQLTVAMGLLGMILAIVGVYSVVSYAAAQRTHEIGIRMALGAERGDILKMVLAQGLGVVGFGIALGLLASFAGTRAMANLFVGIKPTDPLTYVAVLLLLAGVALLACYIPARRATRIDPLVALRYE